MKKILQGVRVIELSTYAAAPGAGRMLADFGADVVKIEPLGGDPHRNFGKLVSAPVLEEENPCFQLANSNKRGIALNLKSQEGMAVFIELLKDAHIFLTNTRIESLRKLKIAYEDLRPRFPHLVYGHLSGYGLEGEDAGLPGFDITAFWARGGGLADFATQGNGPIAVPYAVGDHAASLGMAAGLLGALYKQAQTGEGEYVLVSLFGIAVWINALMITPAQAPYGDEWPKSRYLPMTPISNTYACRDGEFITLCVLDYERDWPKFCKVIDREDLVSENRFNNPLAAKEPANSKELVVLLSDIFAAQNRDYWLERLVRLDVPHGRTQHLREVVDDPQAWANGYLSRFTYDSGNTTVLPNTPVQIGGNVGAPCGRAPYLGEHTTEVLRETGYTPDDIKDLVSCGAVSVRRSPGPETAGEPRTAKFDQTGVKPPITRTREHPGASCSDSSSMS